METITEKDKMTVSEFRSRLYEETDSFYYKLMEGELIKKSAPAPLHQAILRNIVFEIESFNRVHRLGKVFFSPIDVVLDNYNVFQPDLIFIAAENKDIITKDGIKGAPDLVIEIISPSSVMRNRVYKKRVYERCGVKEYWLVSPEYEEVEIFVPKSDVYGLHSAATKSEGELQSTVLMELKLDLKLFFEIQV